MVDNVGVLLPESVVVKHIPPVSGVDHPIQNVRPLMVVK